MLWFTSWLQTLGESPAVIAADRAIGLTDLSIDGAIGALDRLARQNVNSCRSEHVEMVRQAAMRVGPVKEISLIGASGQTLCTDAGTSIEQRALIASAASFRDGIVLDVVSIGEGNERALRVRRLAAAGQPALAALLSVQLLLPRVDAEGQPFSGLARMTLADGTFIGATGDETAADGPDHISGHARSERYGPVVTVAMIRNGAIATYDDLRRIGMVGSGLIAVGILLSAFVIPWRQRYNPMTEIERALVAGQFVPYYQPIVDIKSGRLLGAEVLVRWRKPDGAIVPPIQFIPLIESSDLVIDLTRALMQQVCREVGPAIGRRSDMYIAFNIAPRHFVDEVILKDVSAAFENSPIRLSQLVLEVTERHQIENLTETRRVIAGLQGLGCRIAIDDVGTGHNGLSSILKLGVDIIKIDKLFVEAIGAERHSQAIVETLVDLARNLRMQIVAEGVENFEQVIYLREHGISAAQGYVFAPALPTSAFLQLVEAIDPIAADPANAPATPAPQGLPAPGRFAAA